MTLDDRLTRGFLAGVLAGIPTIITGLITRFILHATTLLYTDFASILVFGTKAQTIKGHIFSFVVVCMFWGLDGIIFAYLISKVTSKNILLKGFIWGGLIWFFSYVTTLLFKVPGLLIIPEKTAISQLVGGVIWGGLLAIIFNYLDKKAAIKS